MTSEKRKNLIRFSRIITILLVAAIFFLVPGNELFLYSFANGVVLERSEVKVLFAAEGLFASLCFNWIMGKLADTIDSQRQEEPELTSLKLRAAILNGFLILVNSLIPVGLVLALIWNLK